MQLLRRVNSHYISLEELASLLYPGDELSDYNQKDVEQASILEKRKKTKKQSHPTYFRREYKKNKAKNYKKKHRLCRSKADMITNLGLTNLLPMERY